MTYQVQQGYCEADIERFPSQILMISTSPTHELPLRPSQQVTKMPLIEDSQPIPQEDPSVVSERTHQIRVKNRRKLYLDRHPSYFTNADLELAGIPLLLLYFKDRD